LYGGAQCLPLYRYDETGIRYDNMTDWGLNQFVEHYKDNNITKEDIFHYTYGILHHSDYRIKYELNLKDDFPRLPFYDNFFKWAAWGKQLMDLHIDYETVAPYDLRVVDNSKVFDKKYKLKVKLKANPELGTIEIDEQTYLLGIPNEAWQYKLGNRCAIDWVLDQYKEKKIADKTVAEQFDDFRFADYKDEVIDLLKKVCTVSVETIRITNEMESYS
jgi:predicted helicase